MEHVPVASTRSNYRLRKDMERSQGRMDYRAVERWNGMEYLHLENKTNEPSGKNAKGHYPTTRFYVPKTKVKTEQKMITCHECGARRKGKWQ